MKLKNICALFAALLFLFSCAFAEDADVLLTVNGAPITRAEIESTVDVLESWYGSEGSADADLTATFYRMAVSYEIQWALMYEKAEEYGLLPLSAEDQQEAQEAWESFVNSYMAYIYAIDDDSTEEEIATARAETLTLLSDLGYTEAAYTEEYQQNLLFERVEAEIGKGITVTDEEIEAYYNDLVAFDRESWESDPDAYIQQLESYWNYGEYAEYYGVTESYYMPDGYRGVLQILLPVDSALLDTWQEKAAELEEYYEKLESGEATATDAASDTDLITQTDVDAARDAVLASVRDTIDAINTRLAAGEKFADLISEYNTDPGMQEDGILETGYSVHQDSVIWNVSFVQAAFSMSKPGEWSAPMVDENGVHILYYLRDIPEGGTGLSEELRVQIREVLQAQKESALQSETMTQWIEEAEIVYQGDGQAMADGTYQPAAE